MQTVQPAEALDKNRLSGAWEEGKEYLDSVFELSTVQLITQTCDCRQRRLDEVESNAVVSLHHKQFGVHAKFT